MKVFISWSGTRSQVLANHLHDWLPGVINAIEPWMSSSDIDPGVRWNSKIADELNFTKYGIVCVTNENVNNPWLLFEAGALSKSVESARVVPLLLDHKPSEIKGPLAQFQSLQANKRDIKKLITGLNLTVKSENEIGVDNDKLDEAFELWWDKLNKPIMSIPKSEKDSSEKTRNQKEITEETLLIVRDIRRKLNLLDTQRQVKELSSTDLPPAPEAFPPGWDETWQPDFEFIDKRSREE
jgi:hypothetical protein